MQGSVRGEPGDRLSYRVAIHCRYAVYHKIGQKHLFAFFVQAPVKTLIDKTRCS